MYFVDSSIRPYYNVSHQFKGETYTHFQVSIVPTTDLLHAMSNKHETILHSKISNYSALSAIIVIPCCEWDNENSSYHFLKQLELKRLKRIPFLSVSTKHLLTQVVHIFSGECVLLYMHSMRVSLAIAWEFRQQWWCYLNQTSVIKFTYICSVCYRFVGKFSARFVHNIYLQHQISLSYSNH